ncbi:MAG: bifunctional 3-(3-hydroxy-phenyl)propionate/3-hydroxycinnamic acid hydroxylase [Actinomycetota bacterium]|nr:bifunctional 3-(3-hydroxy-phenyl)propionate/3-hydroxycinnamic acid hydroxylase [Actinomycetota bacterium]
MVEEPGLRPETETDVLIVGGGPVGIALAILLAQRKVRVTVVERHPALYALPRAVHLDDEVYRILHDLGVGREFDGISIPGLGLRLVDGRQRVLAQFERGQSKSGLPQANMFDQPELERLLRARLAEFSTARLIEHTALVSFTDDADRVRAQLRHVGSDSAAEISARYLVGCDGANSTVRTQLGVQNTDLGFDQRWLIADIRSSEHIGDWDGVHQVCDSARAGTFMRVGLDRYRWEFQLRDDEDMSAFTDVASLRGLMDPWIGHLADTQLELIRCVEYTFRARVANQWRVGRVMLAGDACHLMPPFIGQGLGVGLRDAANLSWKLTAALTSSRPDLLLDSYQAERRPHAVALVKRAVLIGSLMTGGGRLANAARRIVVPIAGMLAARFGDTISSTSPPLVPGPLVMSDSARRARGTLMPLERITTLQESCFVDQMMGGGFGFIALDTIDSAELARARTELPVVLVSHRSDDPGERALALWLIRLKATCALIRPDRVVMAIGRAPHQLLEHPRVRAVLPERVGSLDDSARVQVPRAAQ